MRSSSVANPTMQLWSMAAMAGPGWICSLVRPTTSETPSTTMPTTRAPTLTMMTTVKSS